jgi:hypothetical protein
MAITERGVGAGVGFTLNEEQRSLRELAPDFADKEFRP